MDNPRIFTVPAHEYLRCVIETSHGQDAHDIRNWIKQVDIPADHDKLISALTNNRFLNSNPEFDEMRDILLAKKARTEAEKAKLTDKDKFDALVKAIELFSGDGFSDILNQLHTVMCVIQTLTTKEELNKFLKKIEASLKIKD